RYYLNLDVRKFGGIVIQKPGPLSKRAPSLNLGKRTKELLMRLAILSDIHGNPLALDAVLADIQSQGEVDAYWVLGDFAALGYDPVTPLEKLTALSHASFTRGNTDRYVVTGDLPVQPEQALQDPALLPEVIEAVRSFSWTRG